MLALFFLAVLWILLGFGAQFCFGAADFDLGGGAVITLFVLGVVIAAGELIFFFYIAFRAYQYFSGTG